MPFLQIDGVYNILFYITEVITVKRILLTLVVALTATIFAGCYGEIEEIGILLDEADTIISDNFAEVEDYNETPNNLNVPETDEFTDEDDLLNIGEQIIAGDIADIGNDTETVDVPDESALPSTDEFTLDIDGTYTTAEDVSLYIYLYDDLPDNFITKSEARELGWRGGGLDDYAPGMCIGGDTFGNREGLLPKAKGRVYTECDINTLGEDSRGAERIVFSNDGLLYYTDDHYESFILLYDEDGKAAA